MQRMMCKSKINKARVTQAELNYEGSITIDEALLKAADILPGEKVEVLNLNNGSRIETYAITAKANSGVVCLNGPAARSGQVGDEVIVLAYCYVDDKDAGSVKMKVVNIDSSNSIKNKVLR